MLSLLTALLLLSTALAAPSTRLRFVVFYHTGREVDWLESSVPTTQVTIIQKNMPRWSNDKYYAVYEPYEKVLRVANLQRLQAGQINIATKVLKDMETVLRAHIVIRITPAPPEKRPPGSAWRPGLGGPGRQGKGGDGSSGGSDGSPPSSPPHMSEGSDGSSRSGSRSGSNSPPSRGSRSGSHSPPSSGGSNSGSGRSGSGSDGGRSPSPPLMRPLVCRCGCGRWPPPGCGKRVAFEMCTTVRIKAGECAYEVQLFDPKEGPSGKGKGH